MLIPLAPVLRLAVFELPAEAREDEDEDACFDGDSANAAAGGGEALARRLGLTPVTLERAKRVALGAAGVGVPALGSGFGAAHDTLKAEDDFVKPPGRIVPPVAPVAAAEVA